MAFNQVCTKRALAHTRRWLACAWRWGLIGCLLLALALRALVPQGYMPSATQVGQDIVFAMVVCTPDGPMEFKQNSSTALSDSAHGASEQTQLEHAKTLCSFSAAAWQALLDGVLLTLLLWRLMQPLRLVPWRYRAPLWAPCIRIRAPRAPPLPH